MSRKTTRALYDKAKRAFLAGEFDLWASPRSITPTEAAAMDQDEFREKILDGELLFDEKFIKRRPRIVWWGWMPHIVWDIEASDGKITIRFVA